jgi:tripartite-type tricarboxylate transporter receptor subunit TctC
LKKDPQSLSIGFANAFGSTRHISAGLLMKAIGANPRDLKTVVFKGSRSHRGGAGRTHRRGRRRATNTTVHVEGGKMRVIGRARRNASRACLRVPRPGKSRASISSRHFRGIMGPQGLTPGQVAFWEGAFRKVTETDEWKVDLERNYWFNDFMPGAAFRKELEKEYADTKAVLVDLGLAKQ